MTKQFWIAVALAAVAPMAVQAQLQRRPISTEHPYPEAFKTPQNPPEIPFDLPDPNYFVLPGDANFGEISSVASNSKGHVFILSRSNAKGNTFGGSATQVFEFDDKGKYVRELGRDLYAFAYGHGIKVDKNDDIWVVDKGTNMAVKFNNKTGKVAMVLGRRPELNAPYWLPERTGQGGGPRGANPREGTFDEPTDISWDSKGNMYISDGYVNSRVAKFDKDGNWVGTWGKRGFGPGEFNTVHNIEVDKNDHVWVSDRSNGRLQVFDTEGNFLREVVINVPTPPVQPMQGHQYPPTMDAKPGSNLAYRPGTPGALCSVGDNPNILFVGDLYPGRIYKIDLTGKVLGFVGTKIGKKPGQVGGLHGMACPTENLIYTAEFQNWRSQKLVLRPKASTTTSAPGPAGRLQ
jgi:hypothetical protein